MNEPNKKPHPEGQPQPPPLSGADLALEMVNQLARLNALLESRIKVEAEQMELMDELNGRLETVTRACEIIGDMKSEGKIKIGFLEFAEAMSQADEEIMGEEEEEEDGDIPSRR